MFKCFEKKFLVLGGALVLLSSASVWAMNPNEENINPNNLNNNNRPAIRATLPQHPAAAPQLNWSEQVPAKGLPAVATLGIKPQEPVINSAENDKYACVVIRPKYTSIVYYPKDYAGFVGEKYVQKVLQAENLRIEEFDPLLHCDSSISRLAGAYRITSNIGSFNLSFEWLLEHPGNNPWSCPCGMRRYDSGVDAKVKKFEKDFLDALGGVSISREKSAEEQPDSKQDQKKEAESPSSSGLLIPVAASSTGDAPVGSALQ